MYLQAFLSTPAFAQTPPALTKLLFSPWYTHNSLSGARGIDKLVCPGGVYDVVEDPCGIICATKLLEYNGVASFNSFWNDEPDIYIALLLAL